MLDDSIVKEKQKIPTNCHLRSKKSFLRLLNIDVGYEKNLGVEKLTKAVGVQATFSPPREVVSHHDFGINALFVAPMR